jgi:hypothetical protein
MTLGSQVVEKPPIAALLQKVQPLAYLLIRVDLELFSRLTLVVFEQPADFDFVINL